MKRLSTNDIIALKQADHIVFQCAYMHGRSNVGTITCAKQIDREEFLTWEFRVASSVQFLDDKLIEPNCACHYLIHNSFINWTWQTIAGFLVVGDELELLWLPDVESTPALIAAGLHCDILRIVLYREKYRFHYNIGVLIGKSNDMRMITGLKKIPTKDMLTLC